MGINWGPPPTPRPYGIRLATGGVRLYLTYQPDYIEWLKSDIPPFSRVYDQSDRSWYVGKDYAAEAIARARQSFVGFKLLERVERKQERAQPFWAQMGYRSFVEWQQAQSQRASGGPQLSTAPPSHYRVLFLTQDAPVELIKAAYKTLAKLYHPDATPAPDAQRKMQELNSAYDAIKKERKL